MLDSRSAMKSFKTISLIVYLLQGLNFYVKKYILTLKTLLNFFLFDRSFTGIHKILS